MQESGTKTRFTCSNRETHYEEMTQHCTARDHRLTAARVPRKSFLCFSVRNKDTFHSDLHVSSVYIHDRKLEQAVSKEGENGLGF